MIVRNNTSNSYVTRTSAQMKLKTNEIGTSKKQSFERPHDILLGNTNKLGEIRYTSSARSATNYIAMLDHASSSLGLMKDNVQKMIDTCSKAIYQTNLTQNDLNILNLQFQNQKANLDQIANSSIYYNTSLLNMNAPLQFVDTNGNNIQITIPDMRNATSPIGNPGLNDLTIQTPCLQADLMFAIGDGNNPPGGPGANVLAALGNFSGQSSLLYKLANEINNALAANTPGANIYARINWAALNLTPAEQAAGQALMQNVQFQNDIDTAMMNANLLGNGNNTALFDIINTATDPANAHIYLNQQYVVEQTDDLLITSPNYLPVVMQRLNSTMSYIISAENGASQQIDLLEKVRDNYYDYKDYCSEKTKEYLDTDTLSAAEELSNLKNSKALLADVSRNDNMHSFQKAKEIIMLQV